jgi:RNA polymerase sigma factor (sigma-70 family)
MLVLHRPDMLAFVTKEARGLLRFESAEDLTQGVHLRALERGGGFEYRGDTEFFAWVYRLARTYLADRRSHWSALKRRSGRLLRLTAGVGDSLGAVGEPPGSRTGPSTFAARREQIVLATKALDLLLPRDRDLVRWSGEGLTTEEQAERLGISAEAAGRARRRALTRFRKTFRLVGGE